MTVDISFDEVLLEEIAARFDLRDPNKRALQAVVQSISAADGSFVEVVADLATGVGKTFLMSSLVEYLAQQGVRHVLVVTPGSTIQRKTLANFDEASTKYVGGADIAPFVVTPENFRASSVSSALRDPNRLKVFVFNVQQLIRPTDNVSRKVRSEDENLGDALYNYLERARDLVVIADEHHVYHERAAAFSGAIRELHPVALVGLTATPHKDDHSKIVFQYTLGEAIADGHVKVPVIVYRKDGTRDEKSQLRDACQLLAHKQQAYERYRSITRGAPAVNPCLFVVCSSIEHATEIGQILAGSGFIGDPRAVLEITSQSSDEALTALAEVESSDSPIRAIVSVNMLREGWDVRNIAVVVALRKLASQTLTEQILGRGLRLPFGHRTNVPDVDQVDLVAHDSYNQLLAQKDVLRQRVLVPAAVIEVDEHGAAVTTEVDPTLAGWSQTSDRDSTLRPGPGQTSLFDGLDDGDETDDRATAPDEDAPVGATLTFRETEDRLALSPPEPRSRVPGAPRIVFPRRESRLTFVAFTLADIADGDARAAGARFIKEVPTFIYRDALEATRTGDDVTITRVPLAHEEAQQPLAGLDVVRVDLIEAIMQQREVPHEAASKGGAARLVAAFLSGAGVTSDAASAEWGQRRQQQAVEGMRSLIREKIAGRQRETRYELVEIELPIEPVLVPADARNAYNDPYLKHHPFVGWSKSIMPSAAFDAATTEWALAHLLDRDDEIGWWLRLSVGEQAYIPTTSGSYFPDFIAIDTDGTHWVIEGKADKNANDPDVVRKKDAAENWARSVRDDGRFGTWRYLFATESHVRQAAGSWNALVVGANPE